LGHPGIFNFLSAKWRMDAQGVFESDLYRHIVAMTSGQLA
jgi:hypothetical protein